MQSGLIAGEAGNVPGAHDHAHVSGGDSSAGIHAVGHGGNAGDSGGCGGE
jgi:hypothetical protein